MQKLLFTFGTLSLALCLSAAPALAHDEHCHTKDAEGKLADASDIKSKKDCAAKKGTWFHHHQHCHKAAADGKMVDLKDGKDQKTCEAKGGTWTDHGHDEAPAK